jgi:MSHA biogenesis protein MshJ
MKVVRPIFAAFAPLAARINALSARERLMTLGAVLVVLYTLWDQLLMQPLERERRTLAAQLTENQAAATELATRSEILLAAQQSDPDATRRAEAARLVQAIGELDRRLAAEAATLIAPTRMAEVLETLLLREPGLKLVAARSLPPVALDAEHADQPTSAQQTGLFRHGLTLEFEGDFAATLAYLRAIEALPWRLSWQSVDYRVQDWPRARIALTVQTLSLRPGWIGI